MINDADLQALVEIYLDDGHDVGEISKAVRVELGCGLREALDHTFYGLRLAHKANHPRAKEVYNRWNDRYHHDAPLV